MTSVNILFWLVAALLGGLIWAIEAGLASRHKTVVLSSMAASLLTLLFMMFWVEDKTKHSPMEFQKVAKKDSGPAGESSNEEGEGGGGGGGSGGNGTKSGGQNGNANNSGDGKNNGKGSGSSNGAGGGGSGASGASAYDDNAIEYSREPFKDCPKCPDLVIIPKGVATVGVGADDRDRAPEEQPAAVVPIANPLAVGRLEINRQEFSWFVEETRFQSTTACDVGKRRGVFNWQTPGFEQDERHPVVCLSQPEVRQYLSWLSRKSGRVYRLPTENEWEHAARAGTKTPFSMGPVSRTTANVGGSLDGTAVGGLFVANPWGLSDVVGNVWEMTSECADGGAGAILSRDTGECRRLVKGGAWSSPIAAARHAARRFVKEGIATNDMGFRVVREVDERDNDKILTKAQKKVLAQADKDAAAIEAKSEQEAEAERLKRLEDAEAELAKEAAAAKQKDNGPAKK